MIVFPNCKINLGLHIIGKRTDGFHNLETIFYPLLLRDAIEILPNPSSPEDVVFSCSGIEVQGLASDNICIKAFRLLKEHFTQLPNIKIHLLKNIPTGAGLGGGSADGAFVLSTLNEMFKLQLNEQQLIDFSLQLGSDCPFFIVNKPCYAASRGEVIETIPLDLSAYKIVIINTGIHVNTGWAFSQITPKANAVNLKEAIAKPIKEWSSLIINDFEEPVFKAHPLLQDIKNELYKKGSVYASMSGSGSTIFGVFPKEQIIDWQLNASWLQKEIAM